MRKSPDSRLFAVFSMTGIVLLILAGCGGSAEFSPGMGSTTQRGAALTTSELAVVRSLVGGGTTPEYRPTPEEVGSLKTIGTRRLRLINIDENLRAIGFDGALDIVWSPHLIEGLRFCKENGWTPRLVIGHKVPGPLAITSVNRRYGPSSWAVYEKYIEAMLDYVSNEWGFKETEWEVGNEMNVPEFNWVAPIFPSGLTDMKGFDAYMELYSHIERVFRSYEARNPGLKLRLGGPAVAPPGFLEEANERNWTLRFIDEVRARDLKADFISVHFYGNSADVNGFSSSIEALKKRLLNHGLASGISVSEWGLDWRSDAAFNFTPRAGAFSMEFLHTLSRLGVDDAMFLVLSKFSDLNWPSLFTEDNNRSHAMIALADLYSVSGEPLACSTDDLHSGCIAAFDGKEVRAVVWRDGWWTGLPFDHKEEPARVMLTIIGLSPGIPILNAEAGINGTPAAPVELKKALREGSVEFDVDIGSLEWGGYGSLRLY